MLSRMRFGRGFRSDVDGMRLVSGGRVVRRALSGWTAAPIGLFVGVTMVYWAMRLPLWNPHAAVLATLLVAAELFGLVRLGLHLFATHSLLERDAVRVGPWEKADIFIPTTHEPAELLRSTLVAAKAIRGVGRVWLLDGGDREAMRALAAELGVAYLGRVGDDRAALLNHALKHCEAEFIALFDCDHAPAPEFLERTLGYFADERLAFVQTPQDFYNIDSFQHRSRRSRGEFWHEQALLFRVIQPGRDRWNAAFLYGSCALLRRAALDDIGGFAAGTVSEDLHTSLRLHKRGWRSVYHNESLAFGLSPTNIEQYLAQGLRRARGTLQVWRREGILFARGLTPAQRLCYLGHALGVIEGWQKFVLYTAPIIVLLTGDTPLVRISGGFVGLLLAWLGLGVWAGRLASRGYARTLWMEEYSLLRYFVCLRATVELLLPKLERAAAPPAAPAGQGQVHRQLLPQLLLAVAAIVAIGFAALRASMGPYLPAGAMLVYLAWAAVCAGVAIRVSWFTTSRMRHRRGHHRFNLPVPVTIRCGDGRRHLALAQDLSLSGLKIELPATMALPEIVQGKLHLPFCAAGFQARVVGQSDEVGRGRIARLSLQWADDAARDAARALLFGNSLQWDVNHWRELQSGPRRPNPADQSWSFGKLQTAAGAIPCIVRRGAGERRWRVIAYTAFNDRPVLALELAGAGAVRGLSVVSYRSYPIGPGAVFVGELAPSGARTLAMPALGAGRPVMGAVAA
jgi:cellulose synthase (UDP-forming)